MRDKPLLYPSRELANECFFLAIRSKSWKGVSEILLLGDPVEKEVSQMSFALRGGDIRIESQFFAKGQFLTMEGVFRKRIEASFYILKKSPQHAKLREESVSYFSSPARIQINFCFNEDPPIFRTILRNAILPSSSRFGHSWPRSIFISKFIGFL